MPDPCEKCEAAFFEVDVEWASLYAEMIRQRDAAMDALNDVVRDVFARFDYDAMATPSVRRTLGVERVRELRRVLREARATLEAEPR